MLAKIGQYILIPFNILILTCICMEVKGQRPYSLEITRVDSVLYSGEGLSIKTTFSSKPACIQYVQQLPSLLAAKGFMASSIDSLWEDSIHVHIRLFVGEKYTWNSLLIDDNYWPVLHQLGYQKSTFYSKPFDPEKVKILYDRLLDYYAREGYPFAKLRLDSIRINSGMVSAKLQIDKAGEYRIDSIAIKGTLKLSRFFLQKYLDITDHSLYNLSKLEKINQRLLELPYVQQYEHWNLRMLNTGALLNIYLQPKHSNEINAIVGFLPSNQNLGGKLLLSGEVNLKLKNAFSTGETIGLNWQHLQTQSPRLNLVFQKPYFLHSPFGLDVGFDLYKKDSSFFNINTQIGLVYVLSSQQSGKLFLQTFKTNLLNVDTLLVMYTKQLPAIIDMRSTGLGMQYDFNNTDYRLNPRKGNELQMTVLAGAKKIQKSNAILQLKDTSFNYGNLYDSIKQNAYQLRLRLAAAHYFTVGKQATFKTALSLGLFQSSSYFSNELFQIGGHKLLRGFDEESIYANKFWVATLEYRYLLAQNSYFFGFSDFGQAGYASTTISFSHTYLGAGIGLAFETKNGIFNISYAAGKLDNGKFDLRQSKIHLGFASVF